MIAPPKACMMDLGPSLQSLSCSFTHGEMTRTGVISYGDLGSDRATAAESAGRRGGGASGSTTGR